MPTFDTPDPISVRLSCGLVVANTQISATEVNQTTVDVQPVDPANRADARLAEQTKVEYADGRLTVRAPRLGTVFGRTGAIDIAIVLPAGSQVQGETGMGELRAEGRLGQCRYRTGHGEIRLDRAGPVDLRSGSGDISVDSAAGTAEISASNGAVNAGVLDGPATVKNSNGATWIGEVTGDLEFQGANGSVAVDRAHAGVRARTANGGIRVGEVARGTVALETAAGSLDVGVRDGTAAWLDLATVSGRVRNELAAAEGPGEAKETVEVRARTTIGNITVRRI